MFELFFDKLKLQISEQNRLGFFLTLHLFTNSLTLIFLDTAVSALFFEQYDSSDMAMVYIYFGLFFVPIGLAYSYYEKKLPIKEFFTYMLISITFVTAFVGTIFIITNSNLALWSLYIIKDIMRILFALEFGIIASLLLDIRSSRKLMPLITAGSFAASIWGSFSIPKLLEFLPIEAVLFLGTIYGVLTTISYRLLIRNRTLPTKTTNDRSGNIIKIIYANPYTRMTTILGSILSGGVLFFLVHFLFFTELKITYPNKLEMANFLANFYSIANIFNLFAVLVASKLISRFGVLFGIAIMPALLFLISSTSGVLSMLGLSSLLFYGAVFMMFVDRTIRLSIEAPVQKTLYQMTNATMRARSIGFRETVIKPLSIAVTAGFVLFLSSFFGEEIAYLLLAFGSLFSLFYIAKNFKTRYRTALFNHINRDKPEAIIFDEEALLMIEKRLDSPNISEAIYALDVLVANRTEHRSELISDALTSKRPQLRQKAIEIISDQKLAEFAPMLKERLFAPQSHADLAALIRALGNTDSDTSYLEPFLEHHNFFVSTAAFGAMVNEQGSYSHGLASLFLSDLIEQDDDRAYKLIAENPKIHHELLLGLLSEKLETSKNRAKVAEAVISFGNLAADSLINHYKKAKSFEDRLFFIKLISRTKSEKLTNFLANSLNTKEPEIKTIIYKTLANSGFVHKKHSTIRRLIRSEMDRASNLASFALLLRSSEFEGTKKLAENIFNDAVLRIFDLLSIGFDKKSVARAKRVLQKGSQNEKAYAYELIDSMVGATERERFLVLIETSSFEKKIRKLASKKLRNQHQALKELLFSQHFVYAKWLQARAVYALANSKFLAEFEREFLHLASSDSKLIKEAFCFVAGTKEMRIAKELVADLRSDDDEIVASTADWAYRRI